MLDRAAIGGIVALFCVSLPVLADCQGRPDALGTSRVIAIDPSEHQRFGWKNYAETLPLRDHEVVLTFDDGPLPPYTPKVLDALAAECVKATFFLVGEMAKQHPELVQREKREGHSIGTHTQHHAHLDRISPKAATKEIADGIASVGNALGDRSQVAPFFRFPYLDSTAAAEQSAFTMGLAIWSVDVHVGDWFPITPQMVTTLALARLDRKSRGILLLHDIQGRTAAALPNLLRELKKQGFRIVHVVPADTSHPTTETTSSQRSIIK